MGNPKICNILKTADRRAKKTNFGTRGTTVHTSTALLMPHFLSLVWGHFVQFPILQFYHFQYPTPLPIFIRFQPTCYCRYACHEGI